jgi:hypothetical protein
VLRRGEFLIRGFPMELDRSGDVALDPVAGEIQDGEFELALAWPVSASFENSRNAVL